MKLYYLLDQACGKVANRTDVSVATIQAARDQIRKENKLSADLLVELIEYHLANVLVDAKGTAQGCAIPGCENAAVWERVFARSLNAGTIVSTLVSAASFASTSPLRMLIFPGASDFEAMRLGSSQREGQTVAIQFGCWEHIGGFIVFPNHSGHYNFEIVDARLPKSCPPPVFELSNSLWEFLKTAERAQQIGFPEEARELCKNCGLPFEHASGVGLKAGDGDDFWRIFCAYCGTEIEISDAEV